MDWQSDPQKLRAVQDDIYRGKVLRARQMTNGERLDEVLELSNDIFGGVPDLSGNADSETRWREIERRLDVLRRLHEHNLYRPVEAAG